MHRARLGCREVGGTAHHANGSLEEEWHSRSVALSPALASRRCCPVRRARAGIRNHLRARHRRGRDRAHRCRRVDPRAWARGESRVTTARSRSRCRAHASTVRPSRSPRGASATSRRARASPSIQGTVTQDFVLEANPLQLGEVVVTGAGTSTEVEKLGNVRNSVSPELIVKSNEANLVQALAGRRRTSKSRSRRAIRAPDRRSRFADFARSTATSSRCSSSTACR